MCVVVVFLRLLVLHISTLPNKEKKNNYLQLNLYMFDTVGKISNHDINQSKAQNSYLGSSII